MTLREHLKITCMEARVAVNNNTPKEGEKHCLIFSGMFPDQILEDTRYEKYLDREVVEIDYDRDGEYLVYSIK